jgi:hypothetical protein
MKIVDGGDDGAIVAIQIMINTNKFFVGVKRWCQQIALLLPFYIIRLLLN